MATYATDLQTFNLADSDADWVELIGHTTGSAPSETTENYYHNSIAIDQATAQALNQTCGVQWDNGADVTWTSGWAFFVWQKFDAGTNIYSWSAGGMRIGIGSTSGNMNYWNALGDDFGNYPSGGWQNTAIDPELSADQTDGSPVAGSYRLFGSMPNMRAKISKGSPHVIDAIRYGRGEIQVSGTGCTFNGMALANDAVTARWGLFELKGNSYAWKGLMSLGLTGSAITMTDSDVVINLVDTPRIASGFNKIEINHADSALTLSGITINGVKTSITGSAPISKGDFEMVDNATLTWDNFTFNDLGTFIFQSNATCLTFNFTRCGLVTLGGGVFTGAKFSNCPDAVSTVVTDLAELDDTEFYSDGSNHATELTTVGDGTMDWNVVTHDYDAGVSGSPVTPTSTGNEDIYISATTGTVTISVASGATTPSIKSDGAIVNVVAGLLPITISVKDAQSGLGIPDANVMILRDDTKATIISGTTNGDGDYAESVASTYNGVAFIGWARQMDLTGIDYVQKDFSGTISSTGVDIQVSLEPR